MKVPVLLVAYNRPELAMRVLAAIATYGPLRLYVAVDGPRASEDRSAVLQVCEAVRSFVGAEEVRTHFRDVNLGPKDGPVDAISWFFEHEEAGIILEDDCLPDSSFFHYCESLLAAHADNPRVMCISGFRPAPDDRTLVASYSFARSIGIWGWASWRRAWTFYDPLMAEWPSERNRAPSRWRASDAFGAHMYWTEILDAAYRGQIPTWDYQWVYACWSVNGVTCVPQVNLVTSCEVVYDAVFA